MGDPCCVLRFNVYSVALQYCLDRIVLLEYTSNAATFSLSLSLSQIKEVIVRAEENVVTLEKQKRDLDADKKALTTKIKKKKADLDRSGKRLKSLQEVRPAFMDEYEKLEQELQVIYMQQRELD